MRTATWRALLAALFFVSCHASDARPEVAPAAAPAAKKRLSLEQTLGQGERVDFTGELPDYTWAADGVHLAFKEKERRLWIDPASWSESAPPEEAEKTKPEKEVAGALTAAGVPEEQLKQLGSRSVTRAANGGVLVEVGDALWWVKDSAARELASAAEGPCELAELSPDGAHVAFVQANDLVLVDTLGGARRELTQDGSADVFNGKLDWVYQEEVYGRGDFKAFWWSPDSRSLAFLRLDETKVYDFTVVDNIVEGTFRVHPEVTRYPKVGDPNPVAALGVVDALAPAQVRWIDLAEHAAEEPIVVRVEWAPSGALVFALQDRIQTWLQLNSVAVETLEERTLLRETSAGWVNRPDAPRWLADGSFLWLSERSGQRHLERWSPGWSVEALTSGDWSVTGIDQVDEQRGLVWFTATKDGAVDSNLYRIGLDGRGLVRLTSGPGRHSTSWNSARTFFLDRCSALATPPRLTLHDAEGKLLRTLGEAHAPDLVSYATSRWEKLEIPARDGFLLDAAVLPPVDFDPSRRYPVWLPTYSGPDAPSVSNSWNGSSWNQFLAQNGVIVFQVNVRSASGKGQRVIESCYKQLGVQELADLEDAVDWLCRNRSADPARIGISGGSYGGFMAAFALTHSDRFALGVAGSGVFDWRMYDTIYTERYMSTPALNPEGYAKTSVVEAAANLKGHLVITHGEMDDNVHLQNAIQFIYALEKAGKDFDFVLYPQSRHGIERSLRAYDRRLTWKAIQEHLLDGH